MEHNQNGFTPGAPTDERVPPIDPAAAGPGFAPVPVRPRHDGWTPQKQAAFVEALADSGLTRKAAAAVGMTEQSVNRLRRRADAWSFNLACDAAARIGARRLREMAWERAIEGTVRYRYYKGEVVGEERVYDNKLLIHLLGKTERLAEPAPESALVAANWEAWVDSIEAAGPPPDLDAPAPWSANHRQREALARRNEADERRDQRALWLDEDGSWWTTFPAPSGFGGRWRDDPERGVPCRELSDQEHAAACAWEEQDRARTLRERIAQRDRLFGFEGGLTFVEDDPWTPFPGPGEQEEEEEEEEEKEEEEEEERASSLMQAEPSEPSEPSSPPAPPTHGTQDPPPAAQPFDREAWERSYEAEWAKQHAAWKAANGIADEPHGDG